MTAASSRLHVEARPAWSAAVCGLLGVLIAIAVGFIGSAALASATLLDPGSGDDPYVGWVEQGDIGTYRNDYRPDFARPPPVKAEHHGYDALLNSADPAGSLGRALRAFSGPGEGFVAPRTAPGAGGGARFVSNSAGDVLDTTRMTIPDGKFGYLLENPSKSGVFSDSMGFSPGTLGPALRSHLVDNFGTATRSVPMTGGGTLYRVYSDPARQLGPYWTRTRPAGPTQSIIDSALDPAWGNRATSWVEVNVPAGTTFYEGAAAAQGGLVGGGNQVFLPWVDDAWVVGSGGF